MWYDVYNYRILVESASVMMDARVGRLWSALQPSLVTTRSHSVTQPGLRLTPTLSRAARAGTRQGVFCAATPYYLPCKWWQQLGVTMSWCRHTGSQLPPRAMGHLSTTTSPASPAQPSQPSPGFTFYGRVEGWGALGAGQGCGGGHRLHKPFSKCVVWGQSGSDSS